MPFVVTDIEKRIFASRFVVKHEHTLDLIDTDAQFTGLALHGTVLRMDTQYNRQGCGTGCGDP
jgi:hypothetical protein